jgi:glucose/arabinose dehydrogenase
MIRWRGIFLSLLIVYLPVQLVAQPVIANGPDYTASNFRVTIFATNLKFPTSMLRLSDGSILVCINTPPTGGNFFQSTGKLVRLVDTNGNGIADNAGTTIYSGMPGVLTSLKQAGNLIFVTSAKRGYERIIILRKGSLPSSTLTVIGRIKFAFPSDWEHTTYALAVRNTPGVSNSFDVFFNIGSRANSSATSTTVAVSGLIGGSVRGESIYKVTVKDLGTSVSVSGLTQIAKGVRNAAGMLFSNAGNFVFEDNGADTADERAEPLSADELNQISAANIGGTVEHFGFPSDYIEYRTGIRKGTGGIQPLVAFQPIPNPSTGSESEGPVELALVPSRFPASLRPGVFIGFHGKKSEMGLANEENPVVHFHLTKKTYFHFIRNQETGIGHPNWVLSTSNSLFISDVSTVGTFNQGDTGVIYQIKSLL